MDNYIIQEETLNYLADAVREKAGITNDMTPEEIEREIYLLETDTDVGAPSLGVIFYDYDGTVLHSYTVKEARALTALPDGPTHDGLPFAGWTHSLEEVKSTMKALHVGAMYEPETTKLTINITTEYIRECGSVKLCFTQSASNGISINWGDGTSPHTVSGTGFVTTSHLYSTTGEYVIELTVVDGTLTLGSDTDYLFSGVSDVTYLSYSKKLLTKAVVGAINTNIDAYVFYDCVELGSVVIPKGITIIREYAFYRCRSLKAVIIPNSVRRLYRAFTNCDLLSIVVVPNGTDFYWYSISTVGSSLFLYCDSIKSIVLPSSVSVLPGYIFDDNMRCIYLKSTTPPKASGSAFYYLSTLCTIYVPHQSLEQYKAADVWCDIADQIKGMPV